MTAAGATALPDPGSELSRLTAGFLDGSLTLADRDRLVNRRPGLLTAGRSGCMPTCCGSGARRWASIGRRSR